MRADDGGGAKTRPRHPRRPLPAPPAPRPARRPAAAPAAAVAHRRRPRAAHRPRIDRGIPRPGVPSPCQTWAHDRHLRPVGRHDPPPRRRRAHPHRPVGPRHGPAGERRPAPRQLVPRLPQPPDHGGRPRRPAVRAHRAGDRRGRRHLRHPSRRVLPRAHAGVGRAARRRRRAHRGQELARAPRARRPRDGGLLRPRVEGHAHARARELQLGPDHPAGRAFRSPSCRS